MAQLDLDELSQRNGLCLIPMDLQHTGEVTLARRSESWQATMNRRFPKA